MAPPLLEYSVLVSIDDVFIGSKPRANFEPTDIYRVPAAWITNEYGDILTVLRSPQKKKDPDKWGDASSGTLGIGDISDGKNIYERGRRREVKEELGVDYGVHLGRHKHFLYRPQGSSFWEIDHIFLPKNTIFALQREECVDAQWIEPGRLAHEIDNNPRSFTPYLRYHFDYFNNRVRMDPGDIRHYGDAFVTTSPHYLPNVQGKNAKELLQVLLNPEGAQRYLETYSTWVDRYGTFAAPQSKKSFLRLAA